MNIKRIAIIGAGHMGVSLFRGLISCGKIPVNNFVLSNPHVDKLENLKKEFNATLIDHNIEAVKKSDIIIIAVRPKIVQSVMREIKNYMNPDKIIISVAACVPVRLLEKYSNNKIKIFRIMPNVSVAEGQGIIGWIANKNIIDRDQKTFLNLFAPLGMLIKCKSDDQLDKLSMISGCGPGYVAYFMSSLEKKAIRCGFSKEDAKRIVLSTFSGTVSQLAETEVSFEEMVRSIATKGGITEEVLMNMDRIKFDDKFHKSIDAGYDKIKNIEKELEKTIL